MGLARAQATRADRQSRDWKCGKFRKELGGGGGVLEVSTYILENLFEMKILYWRIYWEWRYIERFILNETVLEDLLKIERLWRIFWKSRFFGRFIIFSEYTSYI